MMADKAGQVLPPARRDGLLVQAFDDEVIVCDTERHKAHCLNRTAALVWEHCDGQTPVAAVTRRLTRELQTPIEPAVVWLAVEQLGKAHLLVDAPRRPGGLSRRQVLKRLGVALAVPVVTTIVTPEAARASATCIEPAQPCVIGGLPCCDPLDSCVETSIPGGGTELTCNA